MAYPAFRSAGAIAHDVVGVTPGAPAGLAANDIELLVCESADEAISLATANGFAEVTGSPISVPDATATVKTRGALFWRRWNGTDGDPVTNDPGNHIVAQRYAFSGCITTGNPWDFIKVSSEGVEDTSGSADGDTTLGAERLIAIVVGASKPDTLGTAELSGFTNANLASLTERADNAGNSGNGGHVGLATGQMASSGAIGATTYTKATSAFKWHFVVALKPPGGATQTLTADQASFSLSGQAASVLAQRKIVSSQASFSLSGQAALVLAQRKILPESASFSLSGQSAILSVIKVLTASQGSFILTGQSAGLTKATVMAASHGAFTLTGQNAALGLQMRMTAGAGSFALTGQSANFGRAYSLLATFGSFALSGQIALLSIQGPITPWLLHAIADDFYLTAPALEGHHSLFDVTLLHANGDIDRGEGVNALFDYYLTDPSGNRLTDPSGNYLIVQVPQAFYPQLLHSVPDDFTLNAE